jgi:hypothetical protein
MYKEESDFSFLQVDDIDDDEEDDRTGYIYTEYMYRTEWKVDYRESIETYSCIFHLIIIVFRRERYIYILSNRRDERDKRGVSLCFG